MGSYLGYINVIRANRRGRISRQKWGLGMENREVILQFLKEQKSFVTTKEIMEKITLTPVSNTRWIVYEILLELNREGKVWNRMRGNEREWRLKINDE